MIWKRHLTLDELNATSDNTMVAHLGIVYTRLGDDVLEAEMPVDTRTHQPFGLLHGGASAALAETLGSMAGFMMTRDGQPRGKNKGYEFPDFLIAPATPVGYFHEMPVPASQYLHLRPVVA